MEVTSVNNDRLKNNIKNAAIGGVMWGSLCGGLSLFNQKRYLNAPQTIEELHSDILIRKNLHQNYTKNGIFGKLFKFADKKELHLKEEKYRSLSQNKISKKVIGGRFLLGVIEWTISSFLISEAIDAFSKKNTPKKSI
jgi:hypothetical protein